jgi:sugar-specific transcriptional regulator TrmB
MPAWPEEDLTHLMLYSGRYDEPLTGNAFRTIEELAEELLRMARERPAKGRFYGASDYAEAISIVIDGIKDDLLPEPGESEETFKQRQQETVERYRRPQEAVTG